MSNPPSNSTNIIGNRYGKWLVIDYAGKNKWKCKCDCGNINDVLRGNLTRGLSRSCGCTIIPINRKRMMTHGYSQEKLYRVYHGIKRRCYNQNSKDFNNYGGRGISMCNEWKEDYMAFRNWAIEHEYQEGKQIDRINNDGNYEPNNCQFISQQENTRKKDNVNKLMYNNKEYTLSELSKICNISADRLRDRIIQKKWTIEEAITIKPTVGNNQNLRRKK